MVLNDNFTSDIFSDVKDRINTNFTKVLFGTGTTEATSSDTGLDTQTISKDRQEITLLSDRVFVSGFLDATEQNGNTIAETGYNNDSSELQNRKVFQNTISKTSDKEVWVDTEIIPTITQ